MLNQSNTPDSAFKRQAHKDMNQTTSDGQMTHTIQIIQNKAVQQHFGRACQHTAATLRQLSAG
jgi:hypothetical protein